MYDKIQIRRGKLKNQQHWEALTPSESKKYGLPLASQNLSATQLFNEWNSDYKRSESKSINKEIDDVVKTTHKTVYTKGKDYYHEKALYVKPDGYYEPSVKHNPNYEDSKVDDFNNEDL